MAAPTGFPALDRALGGGWPVAGLTELLVKGDTAIAMRLLAPVLSGFTAREQRWVMLIAPPWPPYAPGLAWQGIGVPRVLVVRVQQITEALWACEEALASGASAMVVVWVDRAARPVLQRLQLRAASRHSLAVLIRAASFRHEHSPALLRLVLEPVPGGGLQVEVVRNRLPGVRLPASPLRLSPCL